MATVPNLRRALPSDAPAVGTCVQAAYAPWVARVGRRPWPMQQNHAALIDAGYVVVAEAEGDVAGVLVLLETSEGLLVENVAVAPTHQDRGIGRALLAHAEREARSRGYASLYLYTNEKMTENIAMYGKAGYVEYERRQEQGFGRVFLRKALA